MTVSSSNDFDQSAANIIKDALILCGGLSDSESPSGEQTAHAMRALNRMVKAWSVKGLKAWCWNESTLTLVISQKSYTIGPTGNLVAERPLAIANARRVVSGIETPITISSRQEYMDQSSKADTGKPVFVYYDPQLTNGVMYVWPAPDAADTIKFSAKQYLEDFDTTANTPYFPPEWLDAIVYNLAFRLCPMYDVVGEDRATLAQQAFQFLSEAEDSDQEQGSVFLAPETMY